MVCLDLEHKFELDIVDWIVFAMEKRVEMLELDLLTFRDPRSISDRYVPSL